MQNGFSTSRVIASGHGSAGMRTIRYSFRCLRMEYGRCNPATEDDQEREPFVKASGAMPIMEHVMLTGQTVIDGPETIPVEVSREISTTTTADGYTQRRWGWYPHFVNINIDEFRKILDGTVRILTRREVIDRTKICIRNDKSTGTFDDYLTPATLFDGLYRPECDRDGATCGNSWLENNGG